MVSKNLSFTPAGRNPANILRYWRQCLRESMLRDLKLKDAIAIEPEHIVQGHLPADVVNRIYALFEAGGKSSKFTSFKPRRAASDTVPAAEIPPRGPVPVLVTPFLLSAVNLRSRAKEGDVIPPVWLPAQLLPDGTLKPDPEHLPFVPRILLDPPVSDRGDRWPVPVASFEDYDRIIRDMIVDREQDWQGRLAYANAMFEAVAGIAAGDWLPNGWQREAPLVVVWERDFSAAKLILPLCEEWLREEAVPATLATVLASAMKVQPIGSIANAGHLGHCGDRALNVKQRDAVCAVGVMQDGQIQAVNGPPGTGKTSLLKTLIADAVVTAALAGAEAPRIIVTSTNNQAVKNAARDLISPQGDGLPVERERWLPSLTHLAAFAASSEQAKEPAGFLLLEALRARVFAKGFAEEAEPYFLERFKTWRAAWSKAGAVSTEPDLAEAKTVLQAKLSDVAAVISAKSKSIAQAERLNAEGEDLRACLARLEVEFDEAQARTIKAQEAAATAERDTAEMLRQHRVAIETLDHRAEKHPLWMRLLSFLPPIEAWRSNLLRSTAVTLQYLPPHAGPFDSLAKIYEAVDARFISGKDGLAARAAQLRGIARTEQAQTESLGLALAAQRQDYSRLVEAGAAFDIWMEGHPDPDAADIFDVARRRIDVEWRATAFDLAMRMREAEFLLRREEWDEVWATKDVRGRDSRPKLLTAYALVVPCIVATVYIASRHCCYFAAKVEADRPMELPIDLLIYDEAGQVSPDLGLPLLGLARRAVAVGDVHQLEPIESFSEASDDLLLNGEGLEGEALGAIRRDGLTHVGGSVMRAFQAATAYTDTDTQIPGVLLRHHFRCVPKIISYCNDLIYKKLIFAKPAEKSPWIAPMSWAHLRGTARKKGGSWGNEPEAESIARWLALHRAAITQRYGGDLDETVAIVTPYGHQRDLLKAALERHIGAIARKVTIGTVHSLQGAERHLVIFSPTVTLASSGGATPFFDRGPNMLNVAVSRAKNAFIVIGDMGLFDESRGRLPSAILARHLFAEPGNELTDVLPALATGPVSDGLERIEGTERHRALLIEAFTTARCRLLISSPFLSQAAIDADDVAELIRLARARKVEVVIYTGLKSSADGDSSRIERTRQSLVAAGARVLLTTRSHAKTLTCDDLLVVEGSFNWLSSSRDAQHALKEASFVVRGAAAQAYADAIALEFDVLAGVPVERTGSVRDVVESFVR